VATRSLAFVARLRPSRSIDKQAMLSIARRILPWSVHPHGFNTSEDPPEARKSSSQDAGTHPLSLMNLRRTYGVILAALAYIVVSPDGLFIRLGLIEQSLGCVTFYKYLAKMVVLAVGFTCYFGGIQPFVADCRRCGWHFIAAAVMEGLGHAAWMMSTANSKYVHCQFLPVLGFEPRLVRTVLLCCDTAAPSEVHHGFSPAGIDFCSRHLHGLPQLGQGQHN